MTHYQAQQQDTEELGSTVRSLNQQFHSKREIGEQVLFMNNNCDTNEQYQFLTLWCSYSLTNQSKCEKKLKVLSNQNDRQIGTHLHPHKLWKEKLALRVVNLESSLAGKRFNDRMVLGGCVNRVQRVFVFGQRWGGRAESGCCGSCGGGYQ